MKILERIEKYAKEYFRTSGSEYVEIMELSTMESVDVPCNCAFNAMVLALKDTKYAGTIRIIHKRNHFGGIEGYFASFADYRYEDGKVYEIRREGSLHCYGEREVA